MAFLVQANESLLLFLNTPFTQPITTHKRWNSTACWLDGLAGSQCLGQDRHSFAKVLDWEAVCDELLDVLELVLMHDDCAIVNIECNDGQMMAAMNVDTQVQLRGLEVGLV